MATPPVPGANRSQPFRLEVHRVRPGAKEFFRLVSPWADGLFTHWIRGRSEYCPGQNLCPGAHHSKERVWKGYSFGHLWLPALKKWKPAILEVTEALELDFRGRYAPGQVWELTRKKDDGDKHWPVEGALREEPNGRELRCEDYVAILRTMYHAPGLVLDQVNPMPPRVYVDLIEPEPLASAAAPDLAKELQEKMASTRRIIDQAKQRLTNGTHA